MQLGINYAAKGKCFLLSFPSPAKCCAGFSCQLHHKWKQPRGTIYIPLLGCEISLPAALFSKKVTVAPLSAALMDKWVWACCLNQLTSEWRAAQRTVCGAVLAETPCSLGLIRQHAATPQAGTRQCCLSLA